MVFSFNGGSKDDCLKGKIEEKHGLLALKNKSFGKLTTCTTIHGQNREKGQNKGFNYSGIGNLFYIQ